MFRKICFLSLAICSYLYAQFNHFEAGIEAGPALGKFWTPTSSPSFYTPQITFTHGTYFRYNPVKFFGIQTGVYLERIATKDEVVFTNEEGSIVGPGTLSVNTDYITFPLLAKFSVGNRLRGNFSFGTFFSYMFKHSLIINYGEVYPYGERTWDYTNQMNRFNTGLSFGAGVDYVFFNQLVIGIEMRNQLGLSNLSKSEDYFRTNSLQFFFRLSWQFR